MVITPEEKIDNNPLENKKEWGYDDKIGIIKKEKKPRPITINDVTIDFEKVGGDWLILKETRNSHKSRIDNERKMNACLAGCSPLRDCLVILTRYNTVGDAHITASVFEGFDFLNWHHLLYFLNKNYITFDLVLTIIKSILKICERFHRYGLVHNDVHIGNIIFPYEYCQSDGSIVVDFTAPKLIDFELVLLPNSEIEGFDKRGHTPWRTISGDIFELSEYLHCKHVCKIFVIISKYGTDEFIVMKRCEKFRMNAELAELEWKATIGDEYIDALINNRPPVNNNNTIADRIFVLEKYFQGRIFRRDTVIGKQALTYLEALETARLKERMELADFEFDFYSAATIVDKLAQILIIKGLGATQQNFLRDLAEELRSYIKPYDLLDEVDNYSNGNDLWATEAAREFKKDRGIRSTPHQEIISKINEFCCDNNGVVTVRLKEKIPMPSSTIDFSRNPKRTIDDLGQRIVVTAKNVEYQAWKMNVSIVENLNPFHFLLPDVTIPNERSIEGPFSLGRIISLTCLALFSLGYFIFGIDVLLNDSGDFVAFSSGALFCIAPSLLLLQVCDIFFELAGDSIRLGFYDFCRDNIKITFLGLIAFIILDLILALGSSNSIAFFLCCIVSGLLSFFIVAPFFLQNARLFYDNSLRQKALFNSLISIKKAPFVVMLMLLIFLIFSFLTPFSFLAIIKYLFFMV